MLAQVNQLGQQWRVSALLGDGLTDLFGDLGYALGRHWQDPLIGGLPRQKALNLAMNLLQACNSFTPLISIFSFGRLALNRL